MLPTKKTKDRVAKTEDGIIWKNNYWKRRTTIFYAGREIGYFQMKGFLRLRGEGVLMDREFEIKEENYWHRTFEIFDKTSNKPLAIIKNNTWNGKVRLYVDGEVFRFRQSIWGNSNWWWQRENVSDEKASEKLVKAKLISFLGKGEFNFGNTGESNLNALILGGLFIKTMNNEGYSMNY